MTLDTILTKSFVIYKDEFCAVVDYDKQGHRLKLLPINSRKEHIVKIVDGEDRAEIKEPTLDDLNKYYTIKIATDVSMIANSLIVLNQLLVQLMKLFVEQPQEKKIVKGG